MDGPGTVNEHMTENLFRRFSLEDKPRSRRPFVVEDEVLLEMVDQLPSASTCTFSAVLGPSQRTINRHLHKLGLQSRGCREVPRELTNDQAQQHVNIYKQLLKEILVMFVLGINCNWR
ncbi:uncharacterized protein LOC106883528 [Octopus bimaculoides]|uniref:uncharacterized protein LOC106883528 n=1 Tax=Octopus bimaculoides TaxID=37653 RepID=UPI00071CEEFD|nr:uncharacterized protein LOC106883528 [Octopus bimaculoides]|eukprot:XP_014790045.1 PREDICTED: uncharacterized protein LOC106883528 [Octopus bimaculoides]